MVTPHTEEYLEAILRLVCPHNRDEHVGCFAPDVDVATLDRSACQIARPSEIAEMVGVSRPSVTTALQRMEQDGLVLRSGKGVCLTSQGFEKARTVLRRHRVSEKFLIKVLGFDPDSVHDEACVLEHSLSERIVDALEKLTDSYEREN
mgnify:FL=1